MTLESQSIQTTVATVTSPAQGPLHRHTHTYDLMRQCIHCGFCLPTCPTYAVLGVEMDSPRGRIYQMQAVADGRMEVSAEFVDHMYCCLGCRACETACPSGVQFGKLIEAAREHIQLEVAQMPLFSEHMRPETTLQEKPTMPEKLMPLASGELLPAPLSEVTPALGRRHYRVGFISGCIMDQVFRDINKATIRVLTANGCEVITPMQQQCCGALHVHA